MASFANEEQLKAIEHSGGVLLKAGAGSGKTFVLKEHMIYLTNKWISEYKGAVLDGLADFLSSKFRSIVLMTFTKKAAGELQLRLQHEFLKKAEEGHSSWGIAYSCLEKLSVTTIHGFCLKLIKEGYFPNVDGQAKIIDQTQFNKKIDELFRLFCQSESLTTRFIEDREKILKTLKKVFSDPSLRISWKKLELNPDSTEQSEIALGHLLSINGFDEAINKEIDISSYSEFKGKKWFDFIESFLDLNLDIKKPRETLNNLLSFFQLLSFKIPISPRAKAVDDEFKIFYKIIKELNAFLKANGEDLSLFFEKYKSNIFPWLVEIKNAFSYIDRNYDTTKGVTFSDLEYIVHSELENKEIQKNVSENYRYLIVDEFQDTSYVQLDIISRVINQDYNRLFCVGDAKQAIYGFRGGELGVFADCEKNVSQVFSLKNNYRSDKDIIHFNNTFFNFIFPKGLKFEGVEKNSVEVDPQIAPITDRDRGEVIELKVLLEGPERFSNQDVELLEAEAIVADVLDSGATNIAVLYKKLKPSQALIDILIEKNIGFTAQVKIPFLEDPLIGIFYHLLEFKVNQNDNSKTFLLFSLRSMLEILGINTLDDELDSNIVKFYEDVHYWGLYRSFVNLTGAFGITNSNFENNFAFIQSVSSLFAENFEDILVNLKDKGSESYSLDFRFGENFERVQIMSAHASKGLEFDQVYIGGIYTNSVTFPDLSIFGKEPLSFKWSDGKSFKKRFKTPEFLLEKEVSKRKDFAESKRLFYVAATRAVKRLTWVDFDFGSAKFRSQSSSWAAAINTFKNEMSVQELKSKSIKLSKERNKKVKLPLFHIDSIGTASTESKFYFIVPELSVTRLASIYQCPRKFYFKNILKLNEDGFKISQTKEDEDYLPEPLLFEKKSEESSNAKRGTLIHDEISQVILSGFDTSNLELSSYKSYSWVVDKLKLLVDKYEFISEKPIKFELFGHMISGIPDLILRNKDDNNLLEVWDFKTGRLKGEGDSIYHFQLFTYAYAVYKLGLYPLDKLIKIVICYVDGEDLVEQNVSFENVESYLWSYWGKINSPEKANLDHCSECPYYELCE